MKYSCFAELYRGHILNLSFIAVLRSSENRHEETVLTPFSGTNVISCRLFVYEKETYGKARSYMFPIRMRFFSFSVFYFFCNRASDVSRLNCVVRLRPQVLYGRHSSYQRYGNTIFRRMACDSILVLSLLVIPEEYYVTEKCEIKLRLSRKK